MRRPGGSLRIVEDGRTREHDTFTCRHCQRVVAVKPKASPSESGGWCFSCDALICAGCAAAGKCVPFEKQLERAEARAQLRRALSSS